MTGPLNPRRDDLGELRDAARDPSDRPGTDGSPPERSDGGRPDSATSTDGDERAVPVEPTTPQPTQDSSRRGDSGQVPRTEEQTSRPDASEQHEPTDEIESYLRSRHRRRSNETHRSERQSQATGDRAASRPPERRQASPGPEASEDGRAPNATAFLAELSGPDVSKPYLDRLPDAYTAQLEVFDWLEELLTVAGHDATMSALEYYESIGWLSERSREELADIASGLSAPGVETAAPSLGVDDHRESLLCIARLAHRQNG